MKRPQFLDTLAEIIDDIDVQHTARITIDGVFLLRPELRPFWDLVVYLDVTFEVALTRALERDSQLFGSRSKTKARYEQRYIPGQRLYLEQCYLRETADILIDNNNLDAPEMIRLNAATIRDGGRFRVEDR